jgi:hypothetical protein
MLFDNKKISSNVRAAKPQNIGVKIMFLRHSFAIVMSWLIVTVAFAQTHPYRTTTCVMH